MLPSCPARTLSSLSPCLMRRRISQPTHLGAGFGEVSQGTRTASTTDAVFRPADVTDHAAAEIQRVPGSCLRCQQTTINSSFVTSTLLTITTTMTTAASASMSHAELYANAEA